MTLIKNAVHDYARRGTLLLFLIFSFLLLFSYFYPGVNFYLKFFTGYFAYGRSSGQLKLFLVFGVVVTGLRCVIKSDASLKIHHLLIFLLFVFQISTFILFQLKTHQELLDISWPTVRGYTSVNAPMHIHVTKPVLHQIITLFLSETSLKEYDTGVPFLNFIPTWWFWIGGVLFLFTVIAQVISLSFDKHQSLLKIICSFSLLKLSIDGGPFNATGIMIIFLSLLIYGGWKRSWMKGSYILFVLATVLVWTLQKNTELEGVINNLAYGIILRGTFFLFWRKEFFKEGLLGVLTFVAIFLLHYISLTSHPWVQGELFPRLHNDGKNIVGLFLPERPWELGDTRSYELKESESLLPIDLYQSKILAYEEKNDECLHRTTSFSATVMGLNEGDFEAHAPSLSIYGRDEGGGVTSLKGYLEGCFPLTRGVQNAVLYTVTTSIKDSFIYKDERIWNNPHIRSFAE